VEYRLKLPDGEVRWVHASASIIRDAVGGLLGVAGMIEDVTARKRASEELLLQQEIIRRIAEFGHVGERVGVSDE
jgi:hypothetical protein